MQSRIGGQPLGGLLCPLAPALRGEGEGEGSSLGNLPVIPREFAALTRSPRHDDQSTRTAEDEEPLTLALSPQSRGEGTKQAAQGLTINYRLHPPLRGIGAPN